MALGNQIDAVKAAQEGHLHEDRFHAIAAELERLASEIAAINRQPFDTRIDLRPIRKKDEPIDTLPLLHINDWKLHR